MAEESKSYSQMRRDFYDKYANKIVPLVNEHENARKTRLVIAIIISGILFLFGSISLYLSLIKIESENGGIHFELAGFAYILAYLSWFWIKKSFENSIKEKIMPTVCSCFGNIEWSQGSYSGGKIFTESYVIPKYTDEKYDDIFKGSYKDVEIEIIEPKYVKYSGYRNRSKKTVFDGVIVELVMNKPFTSHTVIKPKNLLNLPPSFNLHHTELEDIEFNKKFNVYTNDEVDARYLITPSFMERLKNIKTAFNAKRYTCAFYDNLLIIALDTRKDLFSLCSLVKPIDDSKQYFQMYEEIISILKLIDHFKLNQKIGL